MAHRGPGRGHPERDQGPQSLFDRSATVGVLVGLSFPTFVLGELLLLIIYLPLNEHGIHWINTGYAARSARASSPGWGT